MTSTSSLDNSQKLVDIQHVLVSDRVSSVSVPRTPTPMKHFKSGGFMGDETIALNIPTSSHSTNDHLSDSDSEQQRYQKEFENLMLTSYCKDLSSNSLQTILPKVRKVHLKPLLLRRRREDAHLGQKQRNLLI